MNKTFITLILVMSCVAICAAQALAVEKPDAEGKITEIKQDLKMVIFSLGKDDGIKSKDVLLVSRNGKIIGSIRVNAVLGSCFANGKIIKETTKIKKDDDVFFYKNGAPPVPDKKETTAPTEPAKKLTTEERVDALEERLERLEKMLGKILDGMGVNGPATTDNSGEFEKTVTKMLGTDEKKEPKKTTPGNSGEKPTPVEKTDKTVKNPIITGLVVGYYGKGNSNLGIDVDEPDKVKVGTEFFVYRYVGEKKTLIAKVKINELEGDLVGGPVVVEYHKAKPGDQATTEIIE